MFTKQRRTMDQRLQTCSSLSDVMSDSVNVIFIYAALSVYPLTNSVFWTFVIEEDTFVECRK